MRRPYYIMAPEYTERSAGAKALHLLCHELNTRGYEAFIVPMGAPVVNPELKTPMATSLKDGGIAVYPEIIEGNPLQLKYVARWLLYYAGAYRGNKLFPADDRVWGYSLAIALDYGTRNVMLLPTIDEAVFVPPPPGTERKGSCFYAHKYQNFFGEKVTPPPGGVEITNPGQSREELVRLLQTSTVFYAYEDTALMIEAALCGCPVICVPNAHFRGPCAAKEFKAGIARGPEELSYAKGSVSYAHQAYAALRDNFQIQLESFIVGTQTWS